MCLLYIYPIKLHLKVLDWIFIQLSTFLRNSKGSFFSDRYNILILGTLCVSSPVIFSYADHTMKVIQPKFNRSLTKLFFDSILEMSCLLVLGLINLHSLFTIFIYLWQEVGEILHQVTVRESCSNKTGPSAQLGHADQSALSMPVPLVCIGPTSF